VAVSTHEDPLMRALATLPPVLPDDAAALELRDRCRARLERPPSPVLVTLEPASVGAVCAMYAWQLVTLLRS
jgi:hypothetical protein